MKFRKKSLILLMPIMVIMALIPAGTGEESDKGACEMTEMMRQALVLAGCDMEQFDEQNPRFSEQALMEAADCLDQTMQRKYPGVDFKLTACIRRGLNQEYDEFVLEPDHQPQDAFVARVWGAKGGFTCTDSYYGIAKIGDYEALVASKLGAVEPDIKVFSTIDYQFPDSCTADVPIETAMETENFFAYTWLLLKADGCSFGPRVDALRQVIDEEKIAGDYAVYLLTEKYSGISSKEEAFHCIPAHTEADPVYQEMYRFQQ